MSDANKRKIAEIFADIYHSLYKRYHRFLSDSRPFKPADKDLKIVDSSTITLFGNILKGVGRNPRPHLFELKKGSYVVFDKGYVDYEQNQQWTFQDVYFVPRQKYNARYTSIKEFDIPNTNRNAVLKDEKIELKDKKENLFSLRRIYFWYD